MVHYSMFRRLRPSGQAIQCGRVRRITTLFRCWLFKFYFLDWHFCFYSDLIKSWEQFMLRILPHHDTKSARPWLGLGHPRQVVLWALILRQWNKRELKSRISVLLLFLLCVLQAKSVFLYLHFPNGLYHRPSEYFNLLLSILSILKFASS